MAIPYKLWPALPALLLAWAACAQAEGFQRREDGTASAERNTTVTNKETGITYTGTSSWEKGSGASREGYCKDSSGNTVTCGGSR